MDEPLWKPSQERVDRSHLERFRRRIADLGAPASDYAELWQWSIDDSEAFWKTVWDFAEIVGTRGEIVVRDREQMPGASWFPDARMNFAENLLRRRDDEAAIVFTGERGIRRVYSHSELYDETSRWRQAFDDHGIEAGDRIAAWLPNIPEAIAVMLAAASMGATFTSCSPDFGSRGVLDRFGQVEPRLLIAIDAYDYGGKRHDVLEKLAEVCSALPSVEKTIILSFDDHRTTEGKAESAQDASNLVTIRNAVHRKDFLAAFTPDEIDFVRLPFAHPLYVVYSSGTTGPPKCIVHSAGGTLLQHVKEHLLHTDIHPGDGVFYFTTLGWMMWNWLVSALAVGATLHLFDGSPTYPGPAILFDLAQHEQTAVFGTSAKFLEAARKDELDPLTTHTLPHLRTILSTGSPLAPDSFDWVYEHVKADVHLASISGGTDIVSCFMLGNPTAPVYRGELQAPGLGMAVNVFDDAGQPVDETSGELVCTESFPSMPIAFVADPDGQRYRAAYFERFEGVWCHGDFVARTPHGGFVVEGRSDAVLNPGGVRIGTAEIYRQVESLAEIDEAIAVGQEWEDDVRVVLFIKLRADSALDAPLAARIRKRIRTNASPRHVPAVILAVPDIPRTRSGKIVELAVREVLHGRRVKNLEALANPEALDHFRDRRELLA